MNNQTQSAPTKSEVTPTLAQRPTAKQPWRKPELLHLSIRNTATAGTPGPEGTGPFGSAVGQS